MRHKTKIFLLLCCLLPWMRATSAIVTSVGSGSTCPNDEVVIPVTVSNCNGVAAISLALGFDNTKVSYHGYQNLNSAVSTMLVNASGGTVYMTWANMTNVNVGSGTLVELRFSGIGGSTSLAWNTSQCEYSDALGTVIQSNYSNGSVSVYTVPAISSNPSNRNLVEGQNTTFEVGASGSGLSYQWQIKPPSDNNWQNLNNDGNHSNVNSWRLNVNSVTLEMNGNQYRCVVSGTCPSPVTSEAATLTVEEYIPPIPTIVTTTASVSSCPDDVLSVPVSVTHCNNVGSISLVLNYNSNLVTYVGYENVNEQLGNGIMRINANAGTLYFTWASSNHTLEIGDGQMLSIVFKSASGSSSLSWNTSQCEYSNLSGVLLPTSFSGSTLTSYFPPRITSHPSDRTVTEGSNTSFSVGASGQGLSYRWQMSQDNGQSWENLNNGGHYSNVTSGTLYVNNVDRTMEGLRYRCHVSGTCESPVESNYGTLHVEYVVPTVVTTIGSLNTCSETQFGIPVAVTNCNNVGAISLALSYNSNVLTYTGYEGLNPGLSNGQLQVNAANGIVYFTWISLDGASIGNANIVTLDFTAVTGTSALTWNTNYCEYADPLGEMIPSSYNNGNVSVGETSFTITTQPTNQTATMGENATFVVGTSGQTPSYQWQISTDNGTSWSNVTSGAHYANVNTNTLTVSDVALEMGGYRYRCAMSGSCGTLYSNAAVLNVALPVNYYEIAVSASPDEGGVVSGAGAYESGQTCTVTATPNTGYDFINWTEDGVEVATEASYTFVVSADRSLVAHFALRQITITANADPNEGGSIVGAGDYLYGDHILLTATPAEGYVFDNWTENGNVISTNRSISFSAQVDRDLVAHFSVMQVTITAVAQPAGNGNVAGAGMFNYGENVILTAMAAEGFNFDGWTENDTVVSSEATLTFIAHHDRTLVAHFSIMEVTVSAEASPEGSGIVEGSGTYNYGDPVVLTATALGDFEFFNWTEDGEEVSTQSIISFTANRNRHLVAHFIRTITIVATVQPDGSGTVSGTGTYNYTDPVTLTAQPNQGYSFVSWMENDTLFSTEATINFIANDDRSFVANFKIIQVTVDASVEPAEGGSVSGMGVFDYGEQVVMSATPAEGYDFFRWTENGTSVSTNPNYSFTAQTDRNLVAHFTQIVFQVAVLADPSAYGTVSGSGTYEVGSQVNVTATPNFGYQFDHWTENGTIVSTTPAYSFLINSDRNLVAHFSIRSYSIQVAALPAEAGQVTGGGTYYHGETAHVHAVANNDFVFVNWTELGEEVSVDTDYEFVVTDDKQLMANFHANLPELHVTAISHSDFVAGHPASVSWTVRNDGECTTPTGQVWYDRVWLSIENRVAADDNNPILLGEFQNMSALDVGEYYTQTQTFNIPLTLSGDYYLFVITDAYDAHHIYWNDGVVELPYTPPPFIGSESAHCSGSNCGNGSGNRIYEISEYEHDHHSGGSYHDNFFYDLVNIEVPPLPDLQVTSIIVPNNFYSGTTVTVTGTVANFGQSRTNVNRWTDALYISDTAVFLPQRATCLGMTVHNGYLDPDDTYQLTLSGTVPLTMFGEAYFFVKTDVYEQVYEHIFNDNNTSRSEMVNIILTPPADLVPGTLILPQALSTGELLNYTYSVVNQGAGNPNVANWHDKVYLSADPVVMTDALQIADIYHVGGLTAGASYSVTQTIALPNSIQAGDYYLYVVADANNEVFEYLYDANNTIRSVSALTVTRPDLQVLEILVPDTLTVGYPFSLNYTLGNAGDGRIDNWTVVDRIGVSLYDNLNQPTTLCDLSSSLDLQPNQTRPGNYSGIMPNVSQGNYYLFVSTDVNGNLNESDEGNNSLSVYPVFVRHQPLPDLKPVSLVLPEIVNANTEISVSFDIANIGDLDLVNSHCGLDIYALIGNQRILCPLRSQTLPSVNTQVSIMVDDTVHFERTVFVPANVTSSCTSFLLVADSGGTVVELDESNNTITSNVTVINCPLPDLVVTALRLPNPIQSGGYNVLSFDVLNQGDLDLENVALQVEVRAVDGNHTVVCPVQSQVEPQAGNVSIPEGESLHYLLNVLVPPTVTNDWQDFQVVADPNNTIVESDDPNNIGSAATTVAIYPFDLELLSFSLPETIVAGQSCTMSWVVKNVGECPTSQVPMFMNDNGTYRQANGESLPLPWIDRVYVSDDAIVSNNDIQLVSISHDTALNPDGTYTIEQTFTVPYSAVGEKSFICVNDATGKTYDLDRSNNAVLRTVTTELGQLPDLRMTALDVDGVLTAGMSYWVHYSIVNEGDAPTQVASWTDAFYLGGNETNLNGAIHIGSRIHNGILEAHQIYSDSLMITVPNNLQGNYFLLGFTDATSLVYEHDNEADNLTNVPVFIATPLPCDLIALDPDYPATASSGDEITVSWYVSNIGTNTALGNVRDAVYLSADAEWSSDDIMLGYVDASTNLAAGDQLQRQLTGIVQGVPQGAYYVIVKANILHALNEVTYENNVCTSLTTIEVDYPILAIGESVEKVMASSQLIYYRIDVGPEYEHQTLSCRLSTSSTMVANKLYLSHSAVPSLSTFEFGAATPMEQELEILVPSLQQGSYYLLATGSTDNGQPQNVTISASVVNFEILHVYTDHGSNAGSLTTQVLGAKFDSIMDFRLVQQQEYQPAEKVFFSNSTESFVTFDLSGLDAGLYDIVAELPNGMMTVKEGSFTVEEGLPAELSVNIISPSSVRNGNTFTVTIEYGNIGTTDLNVSGLVVVSQNGHPIALQSGDLAEMETQLYFATGEENGNPDVLRPGTMATRTIFVKANSNATIRIGVFAIRNIY